MINRNYSVVKVNNRHDLYLNDHYVAGININPDSYFKKSDSVTRIPADIGIVYNPMDDRTDSGNIAKYDFFSRVTPLDDFEDHINAAISSAKSKIDYIIKDIRFMKMHEVTIEIIKAKHSGHLLSTRYDRDPKQSTFLRASIARWVWNVRSDTPITIASIDCRTDGKVSISKYLQSSLYPKRDLIPIHTYEDVTESNMTLDNMIDKVNDEINSRINSLFKLI
jgi:hypothetical protein